MNKKEILIICLIICAILSLNAVAASSDLNNTDNVVLSTSNVSAYALPDSSDQLQDGSDGAGTFSDLQNDINGGGSIILERNYTYSEGDDFANGITIPNTVTKIDGQGKVVIDAKKQARIFNIASGHTITLTGITFINGNANGNGGSINSDGVLTLTNCNFFNNTATGHGGAVYLGVTSGDTVADCKFTDNVAGGNGGAVDWRLASSDGKVTGSTFTNNVANRSGGAIHWSGHNGLISSSNFINNKALGTCSTVIGGVLGGGDGGAVLWVGSHGIIKDNCNFTDNYAKYRGGAIFLHGNSTENCTNTTITHCHFRDNNADLNGGAIDWQKGASDGILSYSTFINNTAKRNGGAVFWNGHNGTITQCSFDDNHATGENKGKDFAFTTYQTTGGNGGSVIWTGDLGKVTYSNFTNNNAAVLGGAVYLQGSTTSKCIDTVFDNCRFINNYAQSNGGAIDWYRGAENGKVLNSVFTNNTAGRSGGAIHWSGHYGTISNSSFTDNKALGTCSTVIGGVLGGGDGGAVLWVGSHGIINNDCIFINNYAKYRGGAIFLHGNSTENCTNTTVTHAFFKDNVAGLNGGAIDWQHGAHNGILSYSKFINNTAWRSGGAVYWNGINGTVSYCEFTENDAVGNVTGIDFPFATYQTIGGNGGAIIWTGSIGKVDHSNFTRNTAAKLGGAVYLQGYEHATCENTTFDRCKFISNVAGVNGGAIDWHEGAHNGNVYNSTFNNNIAKSNGGAIFWNGHDGKIFDSNFTNNAAQGLLKDSHGNIGDGGAIIWSGINGTVENCRFIDNVAIFNDTYTYGGRGGAVYLQNCTHGNCENTTFKNVYFKNNTAGTNGGAIDWHAGAHDGVLDNGTFIGNTAKRSGGAVFWNGHNGTIKYSKFYNNSALGQVNAISVSGAMTYGGDGGAVMWSGALGKVERCNFVNNTASKRGGAVFLQGSETEDCYNTTFKRSFFANNVAGTNGGAIDWFEGAQNGIVDNVTFVNNTAKRNGGAIFWNGNNGAVKNSKFDNNRATGEALEYDMNLKMPDDIVLIQGNTLPSLKPTAENAGKLYVFNHTVGSVRVFESWVADKQADGTFVWLKLDETEVNIDTISPVDWAIDQFFGGDGGTILWSGDVGLVDNCTFIRSNSARRGGGAYMTGSDNVTYNNCKFINCTSGTNGGGVDWLAGANFGKIYNCVFNNTRAARSAGAIYYDGWYGEMKNITIINTKAWGGSIYESDDKLVKYAGWDSSHWDTNTTGGDAGAIMFTGNHEYLYNVTFINCAATGRGGAVFLQDNDNVTFELCTFDNNHALGTANNTWNDDKDITSGVNKWHTGNGGAIAFDVNARNGRIISSKFTNNVAARNGGAISFYTGSSDGFVYNSTFDNNTAYNSGGAFFWNGNNGTVSYCNFTNNRALGDALDSRINLNSPADVIVLDDTQWIEASSSTYNHKLYVKVLLDSNGNKTGYELYVTDKDDENNYFWSQLDSTDNIQASALDWGGDTYLGGNGGTILWSGDVGVIDHCIVTDSNSARRGGGAYMTGSDNVSVTNSKFTRGTSGTNGGALDWLAGANYGKVINCTFEDNRAARSAGTIYYDGDWGKMENITIVNSHAWGGSIYESDDKLVKYAGWDLSHWDTNTTGGDAGAIMFTGDNILLHNVTFTNCSAVGRGGAVFLQDNDNVTFDLCTFENNRALGTANNTWNDDKNVSSGRNILHTGNGGAIAFDVGASDGYIYNSKFINNVAERNGGAVSFYTGSSGGHIFNSTFDNNTAKRSGGAFFWDGTNGTISYCNFTNNSALGTALEYDMILTYENIVVVNKTLPTASASTMKKLYIVDSTTDKNHINYVSYVTEFDGSEYTWLLLDETHIINDTAPSPTDWGMDQFFGGNGGTILWGGNVGTIDHCNIIDSNSARRGGGAYMRGSDNITFSNCYFANDTSGTNGGALDWLAGANYGKVINCTFEDNRAARSAGTIYYDGDYGEFTNISIKNSYANGGALKTSNDGKVHYAGWDSSHWDTNTTGGDAGAIMITGDHVYIYNATFINCTATGRGGAVFLQDNTNVTFDLCTFENNRALGTANNTWNDDKNVSSGMNKWNTGHGGAIGFDIGATEGIIKNSKFINNTAARDGGAISFAYGSSNTTIYNSSFVNNTAKRNGGAFAWNGNNGNISYSNFTGNKALGIAIDKSVDFTALNQVHEVTKLPSASSSTINRIYVLVTSNGAAKTKYELYVTVPSNDENEYKWVKYIETNETDPSSTDWAVDEYFGGDGGSIVWGGDNGIVDHCIFIDSDSARRGGGAYMKGSDNVTFSNCYFENDTSGTNGGGLDWLAGANYGKVINSTFNNTRAARSAGAIYYDGDYGEMINITIINTTANGGSLKQSKDGKVHYAGWDSSHWDTNTTGGDAGAIMFTGDHIKVYNATFTNCTAVGRGGAVFLQDNNNVTFELCTFEENSALGTANNTWTNIKEERNDDIESNRVDYTLTGHGGAIAFDTGASDGYVINSKFNANHAARDGGAIYYAAGATRGIVINSTFTNHTINYDGGAIYLNGTYCEIHNSTFVNNSAKDDGGAIFWQGNHGTIYNITCDYNHGVGTGVNGTSSTKGGVICLTGSDISVDKSTFTNSYGGLLGGTIFVTGNDVNITNSEFKNSTIGIADGGALYILGNNTLIKNCTFDNCTAPNNGGTIYVLGDNANLNIASITHSTAINGGAIYISGNNAIVNNTAFDKINASADGGVIYISGDGGKLYNSNFTNNFAGDDGGAIFWEGDYGTIENILCYNNTAVSKYVDEDGRISSSRGGAISLVGSDITISKSNFTLNSAIYNEGANLSKIDGGALFITGDNINITDTVFNQNGAAHYGGTIYILGHNDTVSNCSIENTKAINGGAIFVEGDNATISADFKNTNATLSGGSIYVQGFNATIINSTFDDTHAFGSTDNGGGAIFIEGDFAHVIKSDFTNNYANSNSHAIGGAIYVTGDNIGISESTFKNSKSNLHGGAIYIDGQNTTIENSNFTECSVDSSGSTGGAIYVNGINANISGSNFIKSSAVDEGGAIFVNGLNATISTSNFENNKVNGLGGGAIYIQGNYATVDKSNFTKNDANVNAQAKGGAIYVSGDFAEINGSNFKDSTTKSSGGFIYIDGKNASLIGSTFVKAVAGSDGGAIYINKENALIEDCVVNNSKASGKSGAVHLAGANARVIGSSFNNNYASGNSEGGAMYVAGGGAKVINSSFTANTAGSSGGAVYWMGGHDEDQIVGSNFTDNKGSNGGALYWQRSGSKLGNALIKDSIFKGNNATVKHGGAILIFTSNYAIVENCTFIKNGAVKDGDGGAMYVGDSNGGGANLIINSSRFINNFAIYGGGAVSSQYKNTEFINSNFTGNKAMFGGAIVMKNSGKSESATIDNCLFTNSSSTASSQWGDGGGAIYMIIKNVVVANSTFTNCSSAVKGGAITWGGINGKMYNCTFKNCSSPNAGAVYWGTSTNLGKNGNLTNSTFINCHSTGNGGAIVLNAGDSTKEVSDLRIFNCSASAKGGAIYVSGNIVPLSDSRMVNCSAANGGALYWDYNGGSIENITIVNSSATSNGGGIYWNKAGGSIKDITLINNTAQFGGGLFNKYTGTINHANFTLNKAEKGSAIYSEVALNLKDTSLLKNRANNATLTMTSKDDIRRTGKVTLTFRGWDNQLNALMVTGSNSVTCDNVTYWNESGEVNTGVQTFSGKSNWHQVESGQNFTVKIYDENGNQLNAGEDTYLTDANGKINIALSKYTSSYTGVYVDAYLTNEDYYTYVEISTRAELDLFNASTRNATFHMNATMFVNVTSDATGNVSVYYNGTFLGNITLGADGKGSSDKILTLINDKFLEVGSYTIDFIYMGDNNYKTANTTAVLNITKAPSDIIFNITEIGYDLLINVTVVHNITGIVTDPNDVTGNVTLVIITSNGHRQTVTAYLENGTGIAYAIDLPMEEDISINANYNGDDNYLNSTNSTSYRLKDKIKSSIDIKVNVFDIYVNETIIINITVNTADGSDAPGNVTLILDNIEYNLTLNNSKVSFTKTGLTAGHKIVTVTYEGSDNLLPSSNNAKFNVHKYNAVLAINTTNITRGDVEMVNITVPDDAEGIVNVTITGDGYLYHHLLEIENGKVIIPLYNLKIGVYNVTASFEDSKYNYIINSTLFNVSKTIPVIDISVRNVTYGNDTVIIVTVPNGATGNVTVRINDTFVVFPEEILEDAKSTFTIKNLPAGNYTVHVDYYGDVNNTRSSADYNFTVYKADPVITMIVEDIWYGEVENITVKVNARGTVKIRVNGTEREIELADDGSAVIHLLRATREFEFDTLNGKAEEYVYNLAVGKYPVEVIYSGNENYNGATAFSEFEVRQISSKFDLEVHDITIWDKEYINVTGFVNETGEVILNINGVNHTVKIKDGAARFSTTDLHVGINTVCAYYSGDRNYTGGHITKTFNVAQRTPDIRVEASNIAVGHRVKITVYIPENATGYVILTGNFTENPIYINSADFGEGYDEIFVHNLPYGKYSIHVKYYGDSHDNYTTAENDTVFTVSKSNVPLNVIVEDIYYPESADITVTVPSDVSGNITLRIKDTDKTIILPIFNNKVEWRVSDLAVGNYTVLVTYNGDSKYNINNTVKSFKVKPATPVIEISPASSDALTNATVTVKVDGVEDGTKVNITVNGTVYEATVHNGEASATINVLPVGQYNITATYLGDDNHAVTSKTLENGLTVVKVADYLINLTALNITVGDDGNITVYVPDGADGNVTIWIGNTSYSNVTNNGVAKFTIYSLHVGQYSVNATLVNDTRYAEKTAYGSFKVSQANTPMNVAVSDVVYVGDDVVVVVSVPEGATGNITIEINGKNQTAEIDEFGNATFTVRNVTYGNKTIAVTYEGDDNFTRNFTTSQFEVIKRNSFVKVNVSDISVEKVEVINITVPNNATGQVIITIGETNYTVNVTEGKGTLNVKDLPAGTYKLNVTYVGDDQYLLSTNNTAEFTVSKLDSFINVTVKEGQTIVNGSDVTIIIKAPGDVTGKVNVTVNDGVKNTTYTVFVNEGEGILPIAAPEIGIYNVTVIYLENNKYLESKNSTEFEVYSNGKNLTVKTEEIQATGTETIEIAINGNHTGEVRIIVTDSNGNVINDTNVSITSDDLISTAELTIPNMNAGNYTVKAIYIEENGTKVIEHVGTDSFKVDKLPSQITIKPITNITVGGVVTIELELTEGATGNISVFVNGIEHKTNESKLVIEIPDLNETTYIVHAFYYGDGNYYGSNDTAGFKVDRNPTPIHIYVNDGNVGDTVQINVTVPEGAEGQILLDVGEFHGYANITEGVARFNVTGLKDNKYNITARYIGNYKYLPNTTNSSLTISKKEVEFTITPTNVTVGFDEFITIETGENITGTVKVEINGKNYTAFVSGGKGNLTVPNLSADKYNATLYFEGNDKYNKFNVSANFTVKQTTADITVVAQNITFGDKETIVIYVGGTGTVNITVDGQTYSNKPINDGKVEFTVPGYLTADNYTVKVDYNGNVNYTNSSKEVNFTVAKATPELEIHVQDIPYGQTEDIIVTIKSKGNAQGSVNITVNGNTTEINLTKEKTWVLRFSINSLENYNADAKWHIQNLPVGTYPVQVTYNGNENFREVSGETSFIVYQIEPSIKVNVSDIPVWDKEVVNITIDKNATGELLIYVDGNEIPVHAPIKDGVAQVNLTDLNVGKHSILVVYEGDKNFTRNWTSKSFNVTQRTPEINVTAQNITVGNDGNITVKVPANATGYVIIEVIGDDTYYRDVSNGNAVVYPKDLKAGNYTVYVTYVGDKYDNYTAVTKQTNFTVSKVNSTLDVKVSNITLGDDAVINITVTAGATGNVTITIGNEFNKTVGVTSGVISVVVPGLTVGNKTVNVTYNGDNKYLPNSTSKTFSVGKNNPTSDIRIIDNGNGTVTVIMPQNATGNVTIYVDGKNFTGEVHDGIAVIPLENVTPGKHDITAVYSGDGNYTNATVDGTVNIPKLDSTLNVTVSNIKVGDTEVITVELPENATGNVTIEINGKKYDPVSVDGNVVRFEIGNLTYGNKTAYVKYSGDGNYTGTSISTNFTVDKRNSTVNATIAPINVGDGALVVVNVPHNATGWVHVTIGNNTYAVKVENGTGNTTVYGLGDGTHPVGLEYLGDGQYFNSTNVSSVTVSRVPARINVTVENITLGETAIINVTTPKDLCGNVTVTVDDKNYTVFVSGGHGVLPVSGLKVGNHTVNVTFDGCKKYEPAKNSTTFNVDKIKTVPTDIKVIDQGNGTVVVVVPVNATGNVTVKLGDKTYNGTVHDGVAVIDIVNATPGTHDIEVVYSGDGNYTNATAEATATIPARDAPIKVTADPIQVGDVAKIVVEVPKNATGDITITIDGKPYTKPIDGGKATFLIENLTYGNKTIAVEYEGDGNYSQNNTLSKITVSKRPSWVNATITSVEVGKSVTVVVNGPEDATGQVLVDIDGVGYYVNMTNGYGTKEIPNIPRGKYNATVTFLENDKYNSSSNKTSFEIFKSYTEMDIEDLGNGTVVVHLPDGAEGNVTVKLGDDTYNATVHDGVAVVDLTNATPGKQNIEVHYSGDSNNAPQVNNSVVNIPKHDSPITVDVANIKVGDTATVTVNVPEGANGKVTIEINGKQYTEEINGGKAVFKVLGLTDGKKTVAVKYVGDKKFNENSTTAQFTVSKRDSSISASSINIKAGNNEIITVNVPKDATGRVLVNINGIGYYANVVNGKARVVIPELFAGNYKATVTYEGDDKYLPSTTSTSFKVTKSSSSISATGDEIKQGNDATVVVNVPKDATGTVTIKVDGKKYKTEVKNGKAVFKVPGLIKGDHKVDASYSGNKYYDANDTITDVDVYYGENGGDNSHHEGKSHELTALQSHPTGNPVWLLLLVILAIGSAQIRRFRK